MCDCLLTCIVRTFTNIMSVWYMKVVGKWLLNQLGVVELTACVNRNMLIFHRLVFVKCEYLYFWHLVILRIQTSLRVHHYQNSKCNYASKYKIMYTHWMHHYSHDNSFDALLTILKPKMENSIYKTNMLAWTPLLCH